MFKSYLLYLSVDATGLFPPKSYDRRCEPSGGFAGTTLPLYPGGWAQEVAWLHKKAPEIHSSPDQLITTKSQKAAKAALNSTHTIKI